MSHSKSVIGVTLLSLLVLPETIREARAGDDGHFTLVVSRDYRDLVARLVDQHVYVNDEFVGAVSNGTMVRFAVPARSDDGVYKLCLRTSGNIFTGGTYSEIKARPGDRVYLGVRAEMGLVETSNVIHTLKVDNLVGPGRLVVSPSDGPFELMVRGPQARDTTFRFSGETSTIETIEETTRKGHVRLKISGKGGSGRLDEFVAFANPSTPYYLNLRAGASLGDTSAVNSSQFLLQLRACVIHHLGAEMTELGKSLDALEKDLGALRTAGVHPDVLRLRETYIAHFRTVKRLSETSVLIPAAIDLAQVAVQTAIEVYVFGGATPTAGKLVAESIPALLQAAYSKYQLSAEITRAGREFAAAEATVLAALRGDIENRPEVVDHPVILAVFGKLSVKKSTDSASRFYELGREAFASKDYALALEFYDKAIALNPEYAEAHGNRGLVHSARGEFRLAIEDYVRSLKHDPPKRSVVLRNLAIAYYSMKLYDDAIHFYTQAIRVDPHFALAYYERGLARIAQRKFEDSIEDFDRALELDPGLEGARRARLIASRPSR